MLFRSLNWEFYGFPDLERVLWELESSSPNSLVTLIRSAARSLKAAVKSFLRRLKLRRAADTETRVGEERTVEKALEEYRQILHKMFGSSGALDEIIRNVGWWVSGR